jgi:hypothetical protein
MNNSAVVNSGGAAVSSTPLNKPAVTVDQQKMSPTAAESEVEAKRIKLDDVDAQHSPVLAERTLSR